MADKPILTKKFNEELDIDLAMREGGVRAKLYIGVQANDLETAKKALDNMVNTRLKAEQHAYLLEVKMYDILKEKRGAKGKKTEYFSGVSEVDLLADDYRWFLNIVLRYGPSAVEITEPTELKLTSEQMHSIVADVADFAHIYSQQIMDMLKDPERRYLHEQMLKGK
jgi:hypothetical protein